MTTYPILNICARATGHPEQHRRLRELCRTFDDWELLLHHGVLHGLDPLLHKHITESDSSCPLSIRRSLAILASQCQQRSQILVQTLEEVLGFLEQEKFTPIVLKGAALCHTVYTEPGLRPMRDIDILMRKDEVDPAQALLESIGFTPSKAPIHRYHFHLPPLIKQRDRVTVCIELHRDLYPDCPPYYKPVIFEEILGAARSFSVGDHTALTMGDEDMLWYVYQHGFCMPLTYEPYRLVNSADLISLTEVSYATLDWPKVQRKYPALSKSLPLMHHLTPWNPEIIPHNFVSVHERKRTRSTESFQGWPMKKLRMQKKEGTGLCAVLYRTFVPPQWWLMVYYGLSTWREKVWCVMVRHPQHIFWWIRLHSSYLESDEKSVPGKKSSLPARSVAGISNGWRRIRVIILKLR